MRDCEILRELLLSNFAGGCGSMRLTADGRGGQAATESGRDGGAAREGHGGALQKHGGGVQLRSLGCVVRRGSCRLRNGLIDVGAEQASNQATRVPFPIGDSAVNASGD